MNKLTLLGVSFFLFLISYPLISIGTTGEISALWILGLLAMVIAGIIPPATRFLYDDEE